jgi:hypothetical protein
MVTCAAKAPSVSRSSATTPQSLSACPRGGCRLKADAAFPWGRTGFKMALTAFLLVQVHDTTLFD